MTELSIPIQILAHGEGLPLPTYATQGAAGMDLMAALDGSLTITPGERALIPTGMAMAIPNGFEGQVRPRSGLAWNHGITVVNAPGTIDCDYRGEIKVQLINLGSQSVTINRGDRIAQMIFAPVVQARLLRTQTLEQTARGEGGFGSTGRGA